MWFGPLVMSALSFKARVDPLAWALCHLGTIDSSDSPVVCVTPAYLLTTMCRASSNRNGHKNRKIGIRAPKK